VARRQVIEDHVSHERWLVSYADFITLLFAFFVVMYSISQVSESKYRILSDTLTEAFSKQGLENLSAEKTESSLTLDPFQSGDPARAVKDSVIELNETPVPEQKEGEGGAHDGDRDDHLAGDFNSINDRIEKDFGDLIEKRLVTTRGNEEWLEIELSSKLLFGSGSAELNVQALELMGSMANLLKGHKNPVRVEGFTDNQPIKSPLFPSNWELSAARAAAVVQLFIEEGVEPHRLAAVGYGEHQPIADNTTQEGQEKNRRVVLMISKTGRLRPTLPTLETAVAETPTAEIPSPVELPDSDELLGEDKALDGVLTIELDDGGLLFTSEEEPAQVE
jgi:chemotaxis protein MotB